MKKLKKCVVCGFNKRVEKHHIIKKINLGSDDEENLVYLCPNHHWIADFGTEEDRKEILKLIKEITGKTGKYISNKEQEILDLKLKALETESPLWLNFKDAQWIWEDKERWEQWKKTWNYKSNKQMLLGRNIPKRYCDLLNERAEKLILINKLWISLPKL